MRCFFIAMGLAVLSGSLSAEPTSSEQAAVAKAEARGGQMYDYDQAAWHTTDKFREDMEARSLSFEQVKALGAEGYIVEPGENGALITTFYGVKDDRRFAIARYTTSSDGSIAGGFIEPNSAQKLSLLADHMVDAREKAMAAMANSDFRLCSESPANTLVLPPDNKGVISVYILTSTDMAGVYPAGGHYRFDYDAEGNRIAERRFMNTCFPLDTRPKGGQSPEMVFLTHLLDPQPTEIHVFVSKNIPVPLVVGTVSSKRIWGVIQGRIEYIRDMEPKD